MRMKVLLLCMTCVFLAIIIQSYLFIQTSSKVIYQQAKEESMTRLENMQNEIYVFLNRIENNLVKVYNEELFMVALKSRDQLQETRNSYYHMARDLALDNFQTSDDVVAMYIYNSDNQIVSSYRRTVTPKYNYPRDIYSDVMKYNVRKLQDYLKSDDAHVFISSYYNDSSQTTVFRMALKIFDAKNLQEMIGYIICDIDSKALRAIMDKYMSSEGEFIWLQPEGDRQVTSIGTIDQEDENLIFQYMEDISSSEGQDKRKETYKNNVLFEVSQDKYNLNAYSAVPMDFLKKNQKELAGNLLWTVGILLILISMISVVWTRTIIKPLERLKNTIIDIRKGKVSHRVEGYSKDEIGQLSQEFDDMLNEIENLMKRKYEDELQLNKAEYNALQAQINPHFLYNTLDTMSSIASIHGCDLVSNLCLSLSGIFRYSLGRGKAYTSVKEELDHLRNYLFVMDIRTNHSIDYVFEVEEEALECILPRISLQPLVENAIEHGLKEKEGLKRIIITAKRQGKDLWISVSDNGLGMDVESVMEGLSDLSESSNDAKTSIGLYNINSRLKILYGKAYGLKIDSKEGEGTKVGFTVPMEVDINAV